MIIDASIYRNQIISQRIDNDVDSDDEQIASGIKRLHKALADAVELNKINQKFHHHDAHASRFCVMTLVNFLGCSLGAICRTTLLAERGK